MGPTRLVGIERIAHVQVLHRSMILPSSASLSGRCTIRREPELQFSPMFQKAEFRALAATRSRSGGSAQDDLGILAAELEDDALEIRLRGVAWSRSRPTSVEPVKATMSTSMCRQRAAPMTARRTGHDVEDAGGNARLGRQFGQAEGAERGLLGWLDHDAVAGGEGRPDLPGRHLRRKVPGHDHAHHADRLAHDHGHVLGAGGRHALVKLVDQLGVPADAVDGVGNVDVDAIVDRLARIRGESSSARSPGVGLEQVGELEQYPLAVGGLELGPAAAVEGLAGGPDRPIHVLGFAGGDLGEGLAVGGIDRGVGLAAGGRARTCRQ